MGQKTTMFKVVSIIMMVGGIVGLVGNIIAAAVLAAAQNNSVVNALNELSKETTGKSINWGLFWFGFVVAMIACLVQLYAGFTGNKNWNDKSKAQFFIILGGVVAGLSLLSNILIAAASSFNFFTVLSGVVVPVLYIVGAFQLKNQAD